MKSYVTTLSVIRGLQFPGKVVFVGLLSRRDIADECFSSDHTDRSNCLSLETALRLWLERLIVMVVI